MCAKTIEIGSCSAEYGQWDKLSTDVYYCVQTDGRWNQCPLD